MSQEVVRLMSLVKEAVDIISKDKSRDINDVLAGLCKKAELNPQEMNRVVEFSNTLRQLKLFKTAEDKTAEFDIADCKKIKEKIYGEAPIVKEASEDEYLISRSLTKAASFRGSTVVSKSDYAKNSNELIKKAFSQIEILQNEITRSKLEREEAEDNFRNNLFKIAENLDKHGSENFSDFEINAKSAFGKEVEPYLNLITKVANNNNSRALNFVKKNVIKNSENLNLLKSAMVNKELYNFHTLQIDRAEKIKNTWTCELNRIGGRGVR